MTLEAELRRIADGAPAVQPDPDTWARARRARRRQNGVAVLAAAAAVALVAGLAAWLPGRLDPSPADGRVTQPGVPDRLHAVPSHVFERDAADGAFLHPDLLSTDLAVGPAAAAWVLTTGLVAVVDARDGTYHLLRTPVADNAAAAAAALSPDGTRLALTAARTVVVVDLVDGSTAVAGTDRRFPNIQRTAWSPDGRWLAWTSYDRWARARIDGIEAGPTSTVRHTPDTDGEAGDPAVSDNGEVIVVGSRVTTRWDGDSLREWATPATRVDAGEGSVFGPGAISPGGSVLAVPVCCDGVARFVDPRTGGRISDVEITEAGAPLEPLGWLDDETSVWRHSGPGFGETGRLVLVDQDGTHHEVGEVDDEVGPGLTVAVDVMAPDRPTVDRAAPSWPWSSALWGLWGVLLLLGAFGLFTGVVVATPWWSDDDAGRRRPEAWWFATTLAVAAMASFGWVQVVSAWWPWPPLVVLGPVAATVVGCGLVGVPRLRSRAAALAIGAAVAGVVAWVLRW